MSIKAVFGSAVILTLEFVLAAQYRNAHDLPSDFRDAVGSEGAAKQLQTAAPADQDSAAIPSAPAAESAAGESPEPADAAAQSVAADQSVKRIFSENDPWHKRLAQALGINYPCTVETKRVEGYAKVAKLTLDDGRTKESVVVKYYQRSSLVSQLSSSAGALYMKMTSLLSLNHETDPIKMFNNGLAMNEKFRNAGLRTLEVVLTDAVTDPQKPIVVTKFLKGTDMPSILQAAFQGDTGALQKIEKLGSTLAAVHRNNLSVGDLYVGNVIFANGEPYFIDLDRAAVGGAKGWDIAFFFYRSILLVPVSAEPQAWALVARAFLHGYLSGGGDVNIIREARSRRYLAPLAPIYAVRGRSSVRAVRREIKKVAGEGPSEESDEALGLVPSH